MIERCITKSFKIPLNIKIILQYFIGFTGDVMLPSDLIVRSGDFN